MIGRRKHCMLVGFIYMTIAACEPPRTNTGHPADQFYASKEDHFGFIPFERQRVDSFLRKYAPLTAGNETLIGAFRALSDEITAGPRPHHSDLIPGTDRLLTTEVLNAAANGDSTYFPGALNYLFYHDCMAGPRRSKWSDRTVANLELNITFFSRLRRNCKLFDDHFYGSEGHWDTSLQPIFGREAIFNEFTPQSAKLIKSCIVKDSTLADPRMASDRSGFLLFLDETIAGHWRLFLMDHN